MTRTHAGFLRILSRTPSNPATSWSHCLRKGSPPRPARSVLRAIGGFHPAVSCCRLPRIARVGRRAAGAQPGPASRSCVPWATNAAMPRLSAVTSHRSRCPSTSPAEQGTSELGAGGCAPGRPFCGAAMSLRGTVRIVAPPSWAWPGGRAIAVRGCAETGHRATPAHSVGPCPNGPAHRFQSRVLRHGRSLTYRACDLASPGLAREHALIAPAPARS